MTETVQLLLAFTDPPLRLMLVEPFVAPVTDPPHVLERPGVLATCTPLGKLSLTATPVRLAMLAAGLVMVRVRAEVPFSAMLLGEKLFVIVGGTSTANVAEAVEPVPPLVELTLPVVLV